MIDFITQFQEYMKPTGSSGRFVVWSALSAVSAVLERKVWLDKYGGKQAFANMYITLVGHPGCGKSFVSEYAEGLVREMNCTAKIFEKKGVKFAPRILTPAALIKKFSESHYKEDDGYQHSSLFAYCDELSQFIEDIGGGPIAKDLLVFFDCKDLITKSLVSAADVDIVNQYLTALWGTTPFFLKRYLSKEVSGEGLSSRMLFVTDLRKHTFAYNPPQPPPQLKKSMIDLLFQIYSLSGSMIMLPDTHSFFEGWCIEYDMIRKHLIGGGPWVQYMARKRVYVEKTAMLLAASRLSMQIEEVDLKLAVQLLESFEPDMRGAFGVQDVTGDREALWQLLEFIPKEGIYEDTLMQNMAQTGVMYSKDSRYQAYLDALQAGGMLQVVVQQNGKLFFRRLR